MYTASSVLTPSPPSPLFRACISQLPTLTPLKAYWPLASLCVCAAAAQTQSDANGPYAFNGVSVGSWEMQARKSGDGGDGVSTLDAVYILQALAGLRTFTAN